MKKLITATFLGSTVIFICLYSVATANVYIVHRPSIDKRIKWEQIPNMQSEEIVMDLERVDDFYVVKTKAYFIMRNDHFLQAYNLSLPLKPGWGSLGMDKNIILKVGNKTIEINEQLDTEGVPNVITARPVVFRKGFTKIEAWYTGKLQKTARNSYILEYIMSTGRIWRGPIEKAKIIVNFPFKIGPSNIIYVKPMYTKLTNNSIIWQFENIEPAKIDDIYLEFR